MSLNLCAIDGRPTRCAPNCSIAPDATFGSQCSVDSGAVICAGARIGHRVAIGANVVFVGAGLLEGKAPIVVQDDVQIGAGSVIYPGVTLSAGSRVMPGTVVTRSVPHGAIVEGNPSVIVGYVDTHGASPPAQLVRAAGAEAVEDIGVRGVKLYRFPVIADLRGNLTVGEFERQIPFEPRRYFLVYDVPSREIRGEHAHRECHEFLICVRGSCSVVANDGSKRAEVALDSPNKGLHLPPMTWRIQYKYSSDAVLLVFASHFYDAADYIRDYDDFVDIVRNRPVEA